MNQPVQLRPGSLYLVLSETYGNGRHPLDIARLAIAGGVDIIQMREKNSTPAQLKTLGAALCDLCRKSAVTFIVNDDPLLACELDADGVHMGQEDLPLCGVNAVRNILGPRRIIGISTHTPDQFREALTRDVDYVAFGPIFPTQTKDYSIGTSDIRQILGLSSKPVFLIGGIQTTNLDILFENGATNIALIRDLMAADDVTQKTRWYKQKLNNQCRALSGSLKTT
jgi:thiamine-phosphate pyrophosphorylase